MLGICCLIKSKHDRDTATLLNGSIMEYIELQSLVKECCPNLYEFVSLTQKKWDKINLRSSERLQFIEAQISLNGNFTYEANLFDILIQVRKGELVAKYFVQFIEKIIIELVSLVPHKFHTKLKKRAYDIIANFDKSRSCYRDTLGEFVAIISLLKNSTYTLKAIEDYLPNGKQSDYHLRNSITDEGYLIDVLNINFKDKKIKSNDDLSRFLAKRISDKFEDKLTGLQRDKIPIYFTLLPVIWCDLEDVKSYLSTFNEVQNKYNLLPFCTITQSMNEDGSYNFHFYTIDNTIKSL